MPLECPSLGKRVGKREHRGRCARFVGARPGRGDYHECPPSTGRNLVTWSYPTPRDTGKSGVACYQEEKEFCEHIAGSATSICQGPAFSEPCASPPALSKSPLTPAGICSPLNKRKNICPGSLDSLLIEFPQGNNRKSDHLQVQILSMTPYEKIKSHPLACHAHLWEYGLTHLPNLIFHHCYSGMSPVHWARSHPRASAPAIPCTRNALLCPCQKLQSELLLSL